MLRFNLNDQGLYVICDYKLQDHVAFKLLLTVDQGRVIMLITEDDWEGISHILLRLCHMVDPRDQGEVTLVSLIESLTRTETDFLPFLSSPLVICLFHYRECLALLSGLIFSSPTALLAAWSRTVNIPKPVPQPLSEFHLQLVSLSCKLLTRVQCKRNILKPKKNILSTSKWSSWKEIPLFSLCGGCLLI